MRITSDYARSLRAMLALTILIAGFLIVTPDRTLAQATPVVDETPTEAPEEPASHESEFSAAAVNSISFNQPNYILLGGTSVQASLTIAMTGTTSNGTLEIFGLSPAIPVAPADTAQTGGADCELNQQPTGGTVQVLFSSTSNGSCTVNFTIADDGSGTFNGRVYAYSYVNQIPGASSTAIVTFVRPLTAADPTFNVPHGQPYNATLPASGGQTPYSFNVTSQPAEGSVTLTNATTGAFTFTPEPGQFGTYSFGYSVTDSTDIAQSATGSVTLNVAPPPVDAINGQLDVPYEGQASDALSATGGNGSYTYSLVTSGSKGTATLTDTATGAYTYIANPGQTGTDTFTFRATDGSQPPLSDTGTITVTIGPPPLTATPLELPVAYEGDVSGTVPVSGGTPPLTFTLPAQPAKGTVDLDPVTGVFTYSAGDGQTGTDSFVVNIADAGDPQQTTTATVMIEISPAPLVTNDLNITTAFQDSVDGQIPGSGGTLPLNFEVTTLPAKGNVEIDAVTGAFTYTADTNQTGADEFVVTITDSGTPAQVVTSTVYLTIGEPDALVAESITINVTAGETVTGELGATVSGGFPPYEFAPASGPAQGSATIDPDGAFTYTADTSATGTDSFTYTVTDSEPEETSAAATTEGTVFVIIEAAAETPTPTPSPTATPSPSATATATDPAATSTATPDDPDATATATATPDPDGNVGPGGGDGDGDGIPDSEDPDDDNDGTPDTEDPDDDNDGTPDIEEVNELPSTGQGTSTGTTGGLLFALLAGAVILFGIAIRTGRQ